MTRPKVFVTRLIPDRGLSLVEAVCEVTLWQEELPPPCDVLCSEALRANGLLYLLTDRIDTALMDAAPQLKVISQMAVGIDNIDLKAASERRLQVGNTFVVLTDTTADLAFCAAAGGAARRAPAPPR